MRKISFLLALCLTFGLCGCGLFGGDKQEAEPEVQQAAVEPEVQPAAAPEPAKTKPMTKAEKAAAAKKAKAEKAAAAKGGKKSEAQIQAELDATAKKLVAQAARTVMPSKASKSVRQSGKEYIASYVEVDQTSMSASMSKGASAGTYIGSIRYLEKVFECRGKNKKEALSAPCNQVKAKRMNELIQYNGKAWQM